MRLFLSSGKAVGRAGKKYLEKVKRPRRASRLASVSAAQFTCPPDTDVEEPWWVTVCITTSELYIVLPALRLLVLAGRLSRMLWAWELLSLYPGLICVDTTAFNSACRWPQGLPRIGLPGWLQNRGGEASPSSQHPSQQQVVAGKTCFPAKLCTADGAGGMKCSQDLLSVGSRQWGHPAISSLLRVKIYDFALYMDGEQVCALPCLDAVPPSLFWCLPWGISMTAYEGLPACCQTRK